MNGEHVSARLAKRLQVDPLAFCFDDLENERRYGVPLNHDAA